jgi:hypothetical protein
VTLVYGALVFSLLLLAALSSMRLLSNRLFLLYSAAFAFLTILKPFGASPDDYNYVDIVQLGCTSYACAYDGLGRDPIWFFLVSIFSVVGEFAAIKLVATAALLIKLFVIFKLSSNKLYGMSAYVFLFYFLHDLTQYRVSLALAFYFLFLYLVISHRRVGALLSVGVAIGSHIQSAPTLLIYFLRNIIFRRAVVVVAGAALVGLIVIDLYPRLQLMEGLFEMVFGDGYDPSSDVGKYIHLAEAGEYLDFRGVSIAALVILTALAAIKLDRHEDSDAFAARCLSISMGSILFAYFLYWTFASVVDMQNRFFEFFLVPIALVFGSLEHNLRNYAVLSIVCIGFFLKFHVLSTFFL